MIVSAAVFTSDSRLDFGPVSISTLVSHAYQDHVSLFGEELVTRFHDGMRENHLLNRVFVLLHLVSDNLGSSQIKVNMVLSLLNPILDLFGIL